MGVTEIFSNLLETRVLLTSYITLTKSRHYFLDAIAKLRRETISFVVYVCPSVRIEQLGSHWQDFYEMIRMSIFRKSVGKIQDALTL